METKNLLETSIGGATIQIPVEVAVQSWLEKFTGQQQPTRVYASAALKIGTLCEAEGGIYAGLMRGENGEPDYHLFVAPGDEGEKEEISWGKQGKEIDDAKSEYNGMANTIALVESKHECPAAQWATQLTLNNKSDWYLPARRELGLCYANAHEQFAKVWHWSSTQGSAFSAWIQGFDNGSLYYNRKGAAARARAVRRLLVI